MRNNLVFQSFGLLFCIPLILTSCGAFDAKPNAKSNKAKKEAEEADKAWAAARKAHADADKAKADADRAKADLEKAEADLKIANIKNGVAEKPPAARKKEEIDDIYNPRFMPDPDLPKKVADEIEKRRIEAANKARAGRPPVGAGMPRAGGIQIDPRTGKPIAPGQPAAPQVRQATPEEEAKKQESYLLKNHQNPTIRNVAQKFENLGHEVYHRTGTRGLVVTDPFGKHSFYELKEKNEKSLMDALSQAYKQITGFELD